MYDRPIEIRGDEKFLQIKAIAFKNGLDESQIIGQRYYVSYQPAYNPVLNYWAGVYNQDLLLKFDSEFPQGWPSTYPEDYRVYYTLDGSTPDTTSTLINGSIPINGDGTLVYVKAFATCDFCKPSKMVTSYYEIDYSSNPSDYMKGLSVQDYMSKIQGYWIGYVTGNLGYQIPMNVRVTFKSDGSVAGFALSPVSRYNEWTNNIFFESWSSSSTYSIESVDGWGFGIGSIIFRSGGNTQRKTLTAMKLADNGNYLSFELEGSLKYVLTKVKI